MKDAMAQRRLGVDPIVDLTQRLNTFVNVDRTVDDQRTGFDAFGASMPGRDDVESAAVTVASVPCRRLVPAGASQTAIVYLHGGGYVIGSAVSHGALAVELAAAAAATVIVPNYRLAPEHPYPAAVDDADAVLDATIAEFGSANVVVAGDSAGGGLSLATIQRRRDLGAGQPALALLYSPWTDLTFTGPTMVTNSGIDVMVREDLIRGMAAHYAGETPASDPGISPLLGDLRGLPPVVIHVGTDEILLDDSRRLAAKIRDAGGEVEITEWPGMCHVFPTFAPLLPAGHPARVCVEQSGEVIRRRLAPGY